MNISNSIPTPDDTMEEEENLLPRNTICAASSQSNHPRSFFSDGGDYSLKIPNTPPRTNPDALTPPLPVPAYARSLLRPATAPYPLSTFPPPEIVALPTEDTRYVPYRYTTEKDLLKIAARSLCGSHRKIFKLPIRSWSYVEMPPEGNGTPERTISFLRDELSTDRVTYDHTVKAFIVEPSSAVEGNDLIKSIARKITHIPLTPATVLSRYNHRFFDLFKDNGEWVERGGSSLSTPAQTRAAFKTVCWVSIDSGTLAFTTKTGSTVHIWTAHSSFSPRAHSMAAAELIGPDFGIETRVFESKEDVIREFVVMVLKDVDILVHYGEKSSSDLAGGGVMRDLDNASNSQKDFLEIFDLFDYTKMVYTDIPFHTFTQLFNEIDITESGADLLAVAATASIASCDSVSVSQRNCSTDIFPISSTAHTTENIVFFLEKIAARAYLLFKTYSTISRSIFEVSFLSGCNFSQLTAQQHTARGVMTFIDPIVAWSQMVDKQIPHDYMNPGFHCLTHVVPLSSILIENLQQSDHTLTAMVGRKLDGLQGHWWVIRDIFSMRALKPVAIPDVPSVFGICNGMVYSTEELVGFETARQWSSIVQVGLGWIGISMTTPTASTGEETASSLVEQSNISFGYFGIEDVCRHPFDAMRQAVEMFLSLKICSNTKASPRTVAMTTTLTPDNMALARRVTSSNLETFEKLLMPKVAEKIRKNEGLITINLWYRTRDSFTTNPLLADKKVYVSIIEEALTNSFKFLLTSPSSQPRPQVSEDLQVPTINRETVAHKEIQDCPNPDYYKEDLRRSLEEKPSTVIIAARDSMFR